LPAAGLAIVLLAAWALLSALKPPRKQAEASAAPQLSALRGEILDAQTGDPLAGAEVRLPEYDLETSIGKAGQYYFAVTMPGAASNKLRAMKAGYRPLNLDLPPGDHLNVHRMWRSP
jgi:hypothetical protein